MNFNVTRVEREIAGRTLSIETGKIAKQAAGSVMVQYGETVVFTACVRSKPRPGIDFFPLTVDYREKLSAAGKFPGGFMKREGRPTTKEVLTMRMIDRPCRPMFPKGFKDDVQIQAIVLSADLVNDPDILAMVGASAALCISDIPFNGPMGAVRVGYVDGKYVINPTKTEMDKTQMELVLGGHDESVNMIEVSARQLSEDVVAGAIEKGHEVIKELCSMINELVEKCGKEKTPFEIPDIAPIISMLEQKYGNAYLEAKKIDGKLERQNTIDAMYDEFKAEMCPEDKEEDQWQYPAEMIREGFHDFQEVMIRKMIVGGTRVGGRGLDELRDICGEVGFLPRTHGSALFTRGETQGLVTATLGTVSDQQTVDGLCDEFGQKFMLHYNFPPFCVGETGRIMGPGRREIGHGALAEKSLAMVLPDSDVFPYTIKLVSEIMESNGSSSMASVCGGTLAMLDAGVPLLNPVAGISVGMMSTDDASVYITDILGEEDHYGDMDFKVAGTKDGITGIQLDLKARGLTIEQIRETFAYAKTARMQILEIMAGVIAEPNMYLSEYAPRIATTQIPVDMIGAIIGPGGREIKKIQETTGTKVDIEEDGTIYISCVGGDGHNRAKGIIEMMTKPLKIGSVYTGKVVAIKEFGAFIELAPGREGLCHISEISNDFVRNVTDVCKVGDEMEIKVIAIDDQGRIKLSHKAVMAARKDEKSE
ncbi:MAG: polyribonucleotide nucleotidyltransferase [Phycisphaerae bacterium]|nr:polyribonucleotide nucleotidyltransferase [Phycisphaerae bacterium]